MIALLACHEGTIATSRISDDAKILIVEVAIATATVHTPRITVHAVVHIPHWRWIFGPKQHPDANTKQEKQKKSWFKSSILANASVRGSKTTHKSSRSIHGYIWGTLLWNCIVACRICRAWQLIKKNEKMQKQQQHMQKWVFKWTRSCRQLPTWSSLYIRRASDRAWCRRSCSSCVAGLHNHMVFLEWSSASVGKLQHCLKLLRFSGYFVSTGAINCETVKVKVVPISETALGCWSVAYKSCCQYFLLTNNSISTHITLRDLVWDAA